MLQKNSSITFVSTKFGQEKCFILSANVDSIVVENLHEKSFEIKFADMIQVGFFEEKEIWELIKEGENLRLLFERIEKKIA